MARSPFYRILLEQSGDDITDVVTSIRFIDSVSKDNVLEIKIKNQSPTFVDREDLQEGQTLRFYFGYRGFKASEPRQLRIANVDVDYSELVNINLKATDLGILMKKRASVAIWENLTSSEIAQRLADAYGLRGIIDDTDYRWQAYKTANMTDYELLEKLALEEGGEFRFFLRGNLLFFNQRTLKDAPLRTFRYGAGNEAGIISFRPQNREMNKQGASSETTVVDPAGNTNTVNNNNEANENKLDQFPIHFNQNGEQISTPSQSRSRDAEGEVTGKRIIMPGDANEQSVNKANKVKKDAALDDLKASLTIEMDPLMVADAIITMNGVARKHTGNWWIEQVTHSISQSIASTSIDLKKNATKVVVSDPNSATDPNEQTGPDDTENSREVGNVVFNTDGVRINQ